MQFPVPGSSKFLCATNHAGDPYSHSAFHFEAVRAKQDLRISAHFFARYADRSLTSVDGSLK
jgi:hypothetical protein